MLNFKFTYSKKSNAAIPSALVETGGESENASEDEIPEEAASTAETEDESSASPQASCVPVSGIDIPYHFHHSDTDADLLKLKLQAAEMYRPNYHLEDEGDDLSWMVAICEDDHVSAHLQYNPNWLPYYNQIANAPNQPFRVHDRREQTPLFCPRDASDEFSRECGDALARAEVLSAQATAHNSPTFRPLRHPRSHKPASEDFHIF